MRLRYAARRRFALAIIVDLRVCSLVSANGSDVPHGRQFEVRTHLKERLKKHLPRKNVLPSSMRDGGLDSFGKKVQKLRSEGIPEWLGRDPKQSVVH